MKNSRSVKTRGILQNGQGNFKTKKVGEQSGNFMILAVAGLFVHFK